MQYLTIKKRNVKSAKGLARSVAFVVEKNRKYGDVLKEKAVSVRKPVLIVGAHSSGKSYWLTRLFEQAKLIWSQRQAEPVLLSTTKPISSWTHGKHFVLWWAGRAEIDNSEDMRHWTKLKQFERNDLLPLYFKETGAVLFIDDAHLLNGNKLKLAQQCVRQAKVWVITASDENKLSPSLRKDVLMQEPQLFRLSTDIAYDATTVFMWFLMIFCLGMGAYEIAAVIGGLKLLSSGAKAAKQN